jgi:fatty-acyl-CoA synthase
VLIEDEHGSLAERRCGRSTTCRRRGARHDRVEASVPPARDPRPCRHVLDDDPLLVIFTSGSEAAPKGVVLTHANCFWNNLALAQALPLTQDDVVLAILPQFHVAGGTASRCSPGGSARRSCSSARSSPRVHCS